MVQDSFFECPGIKNGKEEEGNCLMQTNRWDFQSEACFVFIMNHNLCHLKQFLFAAVRQRLQLWHVNRFLHPSSLQKVAMQMHWTWTNQPEF